MEVIRQNGKEFGQVRLVQWRVGRYACRYLATRPVCPLHGPLLHDVFPKAVVGKSFVMA
jgi:hypothetical protein